MDVFEAVATPTRREIIKILSNKGRLSATDIYGHFDASPSAISQHLKALKEAKLVRVERQGQSRIYEIDRAGMAEIEKWSQQMNQLWNRRFDALDKVLKVEKEKLEVNSKKVRKQ